MNMRTKTARTFRALFTLSILALSAASLSAQVAVAPLQLVRQQFLSSTGVPLAGGCVNFFAAGTSNPQAIYIDSTGTFQLQNPLPLDAAGEASVWMTNTAYDIVANTGVPNTACSVSVGTQLWRENNKNPFSIILGGSNYIVASGTVDPSGVAGMLAYRTDIPCFRGFGTIWDCFVTLAGTQSLTNKTLVNPIISSSNGAVLNSPNINGTIVTGPPATYLVMANDLVTGTTLNKLAKINPAGLAGFAILPLITDTGGVTGIVTAGAGATGNATIQQNGSVSCIFDNATTSGNYIQISSSIAGDCHDVGVSYPTSGQVIGRSLATNAAIGTNIIDLFGPEIRSGTNGATVGCTQNTPGTIVNNNTLQTLDTCTIPANTLAAGSLLEINLIGLESTASAQTISLVVSLGGGTTCTTISSATGVVNNQPFHFSAHFAVINSGAGGIANMSCEYFSSANGGGLTGPSGTVGAPTIAVNTTISNALLVQVQMSVVNAGNSVTAQVLKAVIF